MKTKKRNPQAPFPRFEYFCLDYPSFHQNHDGFDVVVFRVVVRVVFCLEVVAPETGEALVEEGAHLAPQFLDDLIASVASFAVDESDEDEPLRDGEVLQLLGILVGDFVFGLLHQAFAFRLVADIG